MPQNSTRNTSISGRSDFSCFKAYDIRGRVPEDLDAELCYDLGRAFAVEFPCKNVVVGRDVRKSGLDLSAALCRGLNDSGVNVTDIGICGTEEVYFATAANGFDGGVMITASHNPQEYNGLKLVRAESIPISSDSGLFALRDRIRERNFAPLVDESRRGSYEQHSYQQKYIDFLLGRIDVSKISPYKVVANAGNGCAGPVFEALCRGLPGNFILLNGEPDGSFPNGVPNPLLPERRQDTADAVRLHGADFGLAWDGDFDRCFFYDSEGNFIESYYLVGLLAQVMLKKYPGATILHDSRLVWNTAELVAEAGGRSVEYKTGHAFMKERLRKENAVYGGEMSGHHYFRDFFFCDSGMLPWLILLELLSSSGKTFKELVEKRMQAYPCSGEINRSVKDAAVIVDAVRKHFAAQISQETHIDGLSLDFGKWRCNLRSSNTEPLLRLNVESHGDLALMQEKTAEILAIIDSFQKE